jgi:hypothetical protein
MQCTPCDAALHVRGAAHLRACQDAAQLCAGLQRSPGTSATVLRQAPAIEGLPRQALLVMAAAMLAAEQRFIDAPLMRDVTALLRQHLQLALRKRPRERRRLAEGCCAVPSLAFLQARTGTSVSCQMVAAVLGALEARRPALVPCWACGVGQLGERRGRTQRPTAAGERVRRLPLRGGLRARLPARTPTEAPGQIPGIDARCWRCTVTALRAD